MPETDAYEREILDALERIELGSIATKTELARLKAAARATAINDPQPRRFMQVHGSCHCRRIRYEATADPARTTICHCTDCQALTGSAYRVSVPADEGSFRLVEGAPKVYVKLGDNGSRRAQAFCPDCGSPLYTFAADHPKIYGLRVGCIAEREAFVPRTQKWCRSALGWTESLSSIERRETQ